MSSYLSSLLVYELSHSALAAAILKFLMLVIGIYLIDLTDGCDTIGIALS
jgi:hypothetical protein